MRSLLRMQLDLVAILAALLLMVVSSLWKGCQANEPEPATPLVAAGRGWIASAVLEWRASGLAWSPQCQRETDALRVDLAIERCLSDAWVCSEPGRIHLHPGVEAVHGAGARVRAVVHAMGHLLIRCSELDVYGDPGHWLAVWESAGPDAWVYRAQRRAMGGPLP